MTTQEKLIKRKQSSLELAEYLHNISQTCKIHGVSRQHFNDIKKTYEGQGLEGLRERSRRKPCLKNPVALEIEEAVVTVAYEYPAYGQTRASNELRKRGILVSLGGVRSIWVRHGLETFKKRLNLLEEKSAKQGIVYTEAQLVAPGAAKRDRESHPDEIETEHPGYLLRQDTFYVGYLKGSGRIYQQTAVDTYSSVSFAKVYTARVLTDRGTEFCGAPEKHPYELYLELNDIGHTKTKAKNPQTKAISERVHKTILKSSTGPLLVRRSIPGP